MKRLFVKELAMLLVLALVIPMFSIAEDFQGEITDDVSDMGASPLLTDVVVDEMEEDLTEDDLLLETDVPVDEMEVDLTEDALLLDGLSDELSLDDLEDMESDAESEIEENVTMKYGVPTQLTMGVKESYALKCTKKNLTYKSSSAKVAKVDEKGVITAVKKGKATITVYSNNKKLTICKVTVVAAPKQVTLGMKSVSLGVKEKLTLKPQTDKNSHASFTYTVKDSKIAAVSKAGVVAGKKVGTTTITVKTHNGKKAALKVIVMKAPAKVAVKPKALDLKVGETYALTATLPNKTASNKLTWATSNKQVATVDESGTVTAVEEGTAKITVATFNKKKAVCTVTVEKTSKVDTAEEAVDLLAGGDVSLKDVTPAYPKYDMIPLTGKENAEEKKLIKEANAEAKKANQQIDAYNKQYEEFTRSITDIRETIQKDYTSTETSTQVSYDLGDVQLVVDKTVFDSLGSEDLFSIKDVTENGLIMLDNGKRSLYITVNDNTVILSGAEPGVNRNSASDKLQANDFASVDKAIQFFSEKTAYLSSALGVFVSGLAESVKGTEKLIETNEKMISFYRDVCTYNPNDKVAQQCLKQALEDGNKLSRSLSSLKVLTGLLGTLNIVAEVASLVDIANKFIDTRAVDRHGHPTDDDIKNNKEALAAALNRQIKVAYALYMGSCTISLVNMLSTVAALTAGPAGTVIKLLSLVATLTAGPCADAVKGVYKDLMDTDVKLHLEPTPTPTLTSTPTPTPTSTPTPTLTPTHTPTPTPTSTSTEAPDYEVGSYITFGHYEQDNDLSNGPEPIEWIVLEYKGDMLTLISRYGLDAKPYNAEYVDITWATCTLRSWLNSTFLNTAFTSEEQARIQTVRVTAEDNPYHGTEAGSDTYDKVWLLSIREAENLFSSDTARVCYATETAKANGCWTDTDGSCWWWLRSPGCYSNCAAGVNRDGGVFSGSNSVSNDHQAVRPVVCLRLS